MTARRRSRSTPPSPPRSHWLKRAARRPLRRGALRRRAEASGCACATGAPSRSPPRPRAASASASSAPRRGASPAPPTRAKARSSPRPRGRSPSRAPRRASRATPVAFPEQAAAAGATRRPLAIDPFTVPLEDKLAALDAPGRARSRTRRRAPPVRRGVDGVDAPAQAPAHDRGHRRRRRRSRTARAACTSSPLGDDGVSQRRSYPTWQGGDGFQAGYERVGGARPHGARRPREGRGARAAHRAALPGGHARRCSSSRARWRCRSTSRAGTRRSSIAPSGARSPSRAARSCSRGMLGKLRYGSPLVTLVADATSAGRHRHLRLGRRGRPRGQATRSSSEGLFVDYLSSRETAAALGRASTGTMRADGWNRTPIIRMVNVSLEPGDAGTLEDLVADTDDGAAHRRPTRAGASTTSASTSSSRARSPGRSSTASARASSATRSTRASPRVLGLVRRDLRRRASGGSGASRRAARATRCR